MYTLFILYSLTIEFRGIALPPRTEGACGALVSTPTKQRGNPLTALSLGNTVVPLPHAVVPDIDDQAVHLLRCAHKRASALFVAELSDRRLTPAQYLALTRLFDKHRVSQNHLGRMTAMDPATIQGVIQRLQLRGLVHREPDGNDRRRIMIALTDAGRSMVEQITDRVDALNDQILSPLSRSERDMFLGLLKRLR